MTVLLSPSTAGQIIQLAYEDAQILALGQQISGDQLLRGLAKLTLLCGFWQTKGIKLYLNQRVQWTPVVGQASYSLGPAGTIITTKPTRVLEGYYQDSSGNRRLLMPASWHEYLMLSQQTQQGAPNQYLVDKQVANVVVTIWLVPDATTATGKFDFLCQVQQPTPISVTDTMQFPIEWMNALRWGLASDLAIGQPEAIVARCDKWAMETLNVLEGWDVEDTGTRFTISSRGPGGMMHSRFS